MLRGILLSALGAAIAISAHLAAQQAARGKAEEARRYAALQAERSAAADEASWIAAGHKRYQEMSTRGVAGAERRAEWLDEMKRLAAAHRLSAVEYELSPQQPVTFASSPATIRGFEFMASTMSLKMAAAHEQDLVDFLDELAATQSALLRLRSYRLERLAQSDGSTASRLHAECVVEWITLRTRP